MDSESQPQAPLTEVGRYERLSLARERGLVVSAMELPHWIVREGQEFILRVEQPAVEAVERELRRYEANASSAANSQKRGCREAGRPSHFMSPRG
jgi:hypothetical protein